jgi:hypothetical protein
MPALSALLILAPLPLAAQSSVETTDGKQVLRAEVLETFTRLVGRSETRAVFGLPEKLFWRRSGDLALALFADDAADLRPVLEDVAAPFAEASGLGISIIESGPLPASGQDVAALAAAADLVIVVGPRQRLAELAVTGPFNKGMLARFELGTWPFMMRFQKDQLHRGVVLLADDEPKRAREASLILAMVWGLGGVTLGPEMTGLVGDPAAGPRLTPLGQAVFHLFFHPDLEVGMPLADAVQRAATLLPQ